MPQQVSLRQKAIVPYPMYVEKVDAQRETWSCRADVEVIGHGDHVLIVMREPENHDNLTSVHNRIDVIAGLVIKDFQLALARCTFVECIPPRPHVPGREAEIYNLVTFTPGRDNLHPWLGIIPLEGRFMRINTQTFFGLCADFENHQQG